VFCAIFLPAGLFCLRYRFAVNAMIVIKTEHLLSVTVILLALCFGLAAPAQVPTAMTEAETGIEGVISISPVQGGPTRQGIADSRPLANTSFVVKSGEHEVTSFETDGQGRFRVLLQPGHYVVSRKDWHAAVGSYGPFEVDVNKGRMTNVQWKCDTGIR
jgi:hypothetical protein